MRTERTWEKLVWLFHPSKVSPQPCSSCSILPDLNQCYCCLSSFKNHRHKWRNNSDRCLTEFPQWRILDRELTTLSALTDIVYERLCWISLGMKLLNRRNQWPRIPLNPHIRIQFIGWAGLSCMSTNNKQRVNEWMKERMQMWGAAKGDLLQDISSDMSPQSSSRSQLQARGTQRPFVQGNWSTWQCWAGGRGRHVRPGSS